VVTQAEHKFATIPFSAGFLTFHQSGWTEAHPYGGALVPPRWFDNYWFGYLRRARRAVPLPKHQFEMISDPSGSLTFLQSGRTEAHPYGGDLVPPRWFDNYW